MRKTLIIFFLILISSFLFLRSSGTFLNYHSVKQSNSSFFFLLVGSLKDRSLAVADLHRIDTSSFVVYGKTKDADFIFLDSLGITKCRDTDIIKASLVKLGIPSHKIIQLNAATKSTIDEVNLLKSYILQHPDLNSVTLVTSSYHSRRAYWIVKNRLQSLNRLIDINVYPSPYTATNLKQWWKKKEDAATVLSEYAKLISFLTWEQFTE